MQRRQPRRQQTPQPGRGSRQPQGVSARSILPSSKSNTFPIPSLKQPLTDKIPQATNTGIESLNMLFIGAAHTNAAPIKQRANATAQKVSLAVKHTMVRLTETKQNQDPNDPASVIADVPSYLFLRALREIFDDPDRAFRKGQFRYIKAESLDLPPPRDTPNPTAASLWIKHLPQPLAHLFTQQHNPFFVKPLSIYASTGLQARTLPLPKTHASSYQYCQLLKKAELAGMLRWSLVSEKEAGYYELTSATQLKLFAVSKKEKRTRLISWPRIQNEALSDPPYNYLPDPSLFEAIEVSGPNLSEHYLDIANMFHNITLPAWLTKLFPMETIQGR